MSKDFIHIYMIRKNTYRNEKIFTEHEKRKVTVDNKLTFEKHIYIN